MKSIVVSIHIPKTGGTTLKNILSSVYGDSFMWIMETNSARAAFEKIRNRDLDKINCIHGHIGFGIHKYFNLMGIGCKYIVFTRNVVERLLSYYHYILTVPVNTQYKWDSAYGWTANTSFSDWLPSFRVADMDNGLTRFLSGCDNLNTDPLKYRMSLQDYDIAKENLNQLYFTGSVTNFDMDIIRLANALSWESVPTYEINNSNPHSTEISQADDDLILNSQQYDIDLLAIMNNGGCT